jgi:hypothetical protein|eukprot:scaffold1593_cov193-Alexandrium_tamarense.AAC.29
MNQHDHHNMLSHCKGQLLIILYAAVSLASRRAQTTDAFVIQSPITTTTFHTLQQLRPISLKTTTTLKGLFDDEEESTGNEIPAELRDEIYAAEANTPAAQGRQQRIIVYILLTLAGVTTAFFNAFLSDLRFGDGSPSTDLAYYGFGWVQDNFLTSFLFMNKIGGGLGLLGAGLSGTLAEVEIRSKKENAEKIWEEIQRRKSAKETSQAKKANKKKGRGLTQSSKRDMTGKQKKRLSALEELMNEEEEMVSFESESVNTKDEDENEPEKSDDDGGIFGKIKGFYDKADSMAASQALLLNKELEDRGVIDKITDESGLKVIGKEAAAKAQEEKEKQQSNE